MAMVFIFGRQETGTRENGEHAFVMEMALTFSPMEINTLDSIDMVTQMDLGNTNGLMAIHMQVNLRTE